MDIKKKIIITLAIFLIFGIVVLIILLNPKTTEEEEILHSYADNNMVVETTEPLITEEMPEEVYIVGETEVNLLYNTEILTPSQLAVADHIQDLVLNYALSEVTAIEILSTTDTETRINVKYTDLRDEEMVVTFDNYRSFDYMTVNNADYYDSIINGANIGYSEDG